MTDNNFENELGELFAAPMTFDDSPTFETRTQNRLALKLWFRQWLVVMAGLIGGVYALFQFVRLPEGTISLKQAQVQTDHSLQAGAKLFNAAGHQISGLTNSTHTLDIVQTPMFFWAAFALCMTLLGLYYAYSREEAL